MLFPRNSNRLIVSSDSLSGGDKILEIYSSC